MDTLTLRYPMGSKRKTDLLIKIVYINYSSTIDFSVESLLIKRVLSWVATT